jgi:enoyl-CoA hydratase
VTSTPQLVQVTDTRSVREVAMDRADKFNALSAAMMREIATAVAEAPVAGAKLVVIRGRGERAFCAGADIDELKAGGATLEAWERAFEQLAVGLEASAVPVVTVVYGRVLGGGIVIAGLSDIVVARADTSVGFTEMQFGIYPAMVHAALASRIAASTMFQLCAGARTLSVAEAQQIGLVTEILPTEDFAAASARRVAHYAERTEGLQLGRELRKAALTGNAHERLAAVAARAAEHFRSEPVRKMLAGFGRNN